MIAFKENEGASFRETGVLENTTKLVWPLLLTSARRPGMQAATKISPSALAVYGIWEQDNLSAVRLEFQVAPTNEVRGDASFLEVQFLFSNCRMRRWTVQPRQHTYGA